MLLGSHLRPGQLILMEEWNSSVFLTSLGGRARPEQPLSVFCSLDRAFLAADPKLAPPVPRKIPNREGWSAGLGDKRNAAKKESKAALENKMEIK